jgi:hypothetical protein
MEELNTLKIVSLKIQSWEIILCPEALGVLAQKFKIRELMVNVCGDPDTLFELLTNACQKPSVEFLRVYKTLWTCWDR